MKTGSIIYYLPPIFPGSMTEPDTHSVYIQNHRKSWPDVHVAGEKGEWNLGITNSKGKVRESKISLGCWRPKKIREATEK